MKHCIYIGLLILFTVYGCSQLEKSESSGKEKMKLAFQIVAEDYERDLYYIEWEDTLGKSQGYSVLTRPKEIWCIISNKDKDTLGYYKGLSTAQTVAYFQTTKDTVITVKFMAGMNIFSEAFTSEKEKQDYFNKNRFPVEFKPIELKLRDNLNKKIEIQLEQI